MVRTIQKRKKRWVVRAGVWAQVENNIMSDAYTCWESYHSNLCSYVGTLWELVLKHYFGSVSYILRSASTAKTSSDCNTPLPSQLTHLGAVGKVVYEEHTRS